ncbi:hypothetical protein ANANG_G00147180 [Anguilla anguilla]|uniref:Uncharacterized protein n=1 Tax=Anguilla anguilla TaxID=7936 RepID=A0A9D3RYK9_ANGAN|nr:hypothetical protein ANANG_G00147180 [Anguilla anguilla]
MSLQVLGLQKFVFRPKIITKHKYGSRVVTKESVLSFKVPEVPTEVSYSQWLREDVNVSLPTGQIPADLHQPIGNPLWVVTALHVSVNKGVVVLLRVAENLVQDLRLGQAAVSQPHKRDHGELRKNNVLLHKPSLVLQRVRLVLFHNIPHGPEH